MKEKQIVHRKSHNILKFNMDFWNEVKTFVTENYNKYSVKIAASDTQETTSDFDEAYEKICQYTDSVKTIEISAEAEDEKLDIEIVNRRGEYFKYTIDLAAECTDDKKANKVICFMDSISTGGDLFAFAILLAFGILGIFIINFLSFVFSSIDIGIGLKVFIVLCVYLVLGISGILYMNVMINKTWSVQRIQFWTKYRSIVQYRQMRNIGYTYAAISLILAIALFVVGYSIL
ncbi:MAG: hypothetical protein AB1Z23_13155 [Eubacteriales bacterium]